MMLRLIKQVVNKHNKILWILMGAISFVMASIIAVSVTTTVYLDELQLSKENVYGAFSHIIYSSNNGVKDDSVDKYGTIDIVQSLNEKDIVYGHINDLGKTLGKLNVPMLSDNEIVITDEIARQYQLKVNDVWKTDDKEWYIKGIIDTIGLFWIKGATEDIQSFKMPNVMTSRTSWNDLAKQHVESKRVWLGQFPTDIQDDTWHTIPGSHYRNTFLEKSTDDYHTPEYLLNVASIIFCVIIVVLLRAYIVSARKRYAIYELLGMSKKRLEKLFTFEFLCFNVFSTLWGVLLCGLITSVFLSVALHRLYIVDMAYLMGYFIKYLMMYGMSVVVSMLLFASFSVTEYKWQRFLHRKIYFDIKKIYLSFNIGIFSVLIVFLVGNLFLNFEAINDGILSTSSIGKMASDFDYQFTMISPIEKTGSIYYDNRYHESPKNIEGGFLIRYAKAGGELNQLKQQLLEKFPQAEIDSYTQLSEFYLVNKNNLFQQDYLQKLYETKIIRDRAFWNDLLSQPSELLLTKVAVYPDDKIKLLSTQFQGEVQNVLDGNSAYVVAPAYEYFESFDETNQVTFRESKPIDKNAPNAVYDTKISKGYTLPFVTLESSSTVQGFLNSELAKKIVKVKQINVLVEGISFKQVGWIDREDLTTPYRLIVSENFLKKQGLDDTPTRLRVNIPHFNYEKDDATIRQLVANYTNVRLMDQYGQLRTFRQYSLMQQGFKILLIIIFFTLVILIFNSLIHAHFLEQHHRYLVYGLLGMSRNTLTLQLAIPILGVMLLSTIGISILEIFLFFGRINILSVRDWLSLSVNIVGPMLICTIVSLALMYYHVRRFMKHI